MAGNFAGEWVFLLRSEERVIASGAWNQVKFDYKSCRPELRGNCGMSESRSGRSLQHNVDNLDFLFQSLWLLRDVRAQFWRHRGIDCHLQPRQQMHGEL